MGNIDELKSTGLKATLPRLKILQIFQTTSQRHMTAEDVFRVLLNEHSDIGLATVYRVLRELGVTDAQLRSRLVEVGLGFRVRCASNPLSQQPIIK